MDAIVKSVATGVFSGIVTSYLAIHSLAIAAAIAMPSGFPVALWIAAVDFGIGVLLPAFIVHLALLCILRVKALLSFAGFCVGAMAALSLIEGLTLAGSALASLILGALAAVALFTGLKLRALPSKSQLQPSV